MGRWAQRRHCGGGPPPPATLLQIELLQYGGSNDEMVVTYTGPIDASLFDPADFSSLPNLVIAITATQAGANSMFLQFADEVVDETGLEYAGATPGVLTPQTIDVTE